MDFSPPWLPASPRQQQEGTSGDRDAPARGLCRRVMLQQHPNPGGLRLPPGGATGEGSAFLLRMRPVLAGVARHWVTKAVASRQRRDTEHRLSRLLMYILAETPRCAPLGGGGPTSQGVENAPAILPFPAVSTPAGGGSVYRGAAD